MAEGIQTGVLTDLVLPLALGVIMFGMGLSLTLDDFRRIKRQPWPVALGLITQVLMLPLLAVGVGLLFGHFFGMPSILVLGLLLVACCPGGTTSNVVTYLARADAALSVTVTSVNSIASAITTPLAFLVVTRLTFGTASFVRVSFLETAVFVLAVVVLPMVIGMQLAHYRPGFAKRAERPFRTASTVFFALVVVGVIVQNRADFVELAVRSVPAALLLNLLALGGALLVARVARLGRKQARAVAIETAFQNGTLGIALAITQLGSTEAAIMPGFYSLAMFASGGAVAWWWARDEARRDADAGEPAMHVA